MNILIIDDQTPYRTGLHSILEINLSSCHVFSTDFGPHLFESTHHIDVVVIDPYIHELPPLDVLKLVQDEFKTSKFIVLTIQKDVDHLKAFLQNNVSGIVDKSSQSKDLIRAINQVKNNNIYISQNLAESILEEVGSFYEELAPKFMRKPDLTKREWEILELLSRGFTNAQIGKELFITQGTAAVHISKLQKKLNVSNRVSAVMKAVSNRWIDQTVYEEDFKL